MTQAPASRRRAAAGAWLLAALCLGGPLSAQAQGPTRAAATGPRAQELFLTCAGCHGLDGAGVADGSVPAIAGQYYAVLIKELKDFRRERRWNISMEQVLYQRHLTRAEDLAAVAHFVSALPHQGTGSHGDGAALAAGTRAYFRDCEPCHGALGEGSAATLTPRLSGQHYQYLARQIRNAGDGRRPNMIATHMRRVRQLSLDEIQGIADYLSRLNSR